MRDRELAFGRAEAVIGVPGRERLHDRLRIGEADILDRRPREPPQDVDRVLAAGQHPREPIERRVGVGAAQRFVQRADQVVVTLLRLVVERRPALHEPGELVGSERLLRLELRDLVSQVEQEPAVAIGHGAQGRTGFVGQRQSTAQMGFGAL